jgi:hypothetical protein
VAKKKNDAIMASLHALKANVPTNSRRKETPPTDSKILPAETKTIETKTIETKPIKVKPPESESIKTESIKTESAIPAKIPAVAAVGPADFKEASAPKSVKPDVEAAAGPVVAPAAQPLVEAASAPIPVEKLPETDITVKDFGPGFMEIIIKNLDSMARARDILVGEMGKVNAVIINTFQQSMLVSFDMYKINANYVLEMLGAVMPPSGKPKEKDRSPS